MAYPRPAPGPAASRALCVLLLPEPLERFALRDLAEDLLRAEGVVAVDPARLPYRAYATLPEVVEDALAARQGRRLVRALSRTRGRPRVVVIFSALQYQLARAVLAGAGDPCDLWYGRWQREEAAPGAAPKARARLTRLHEQAALRSSLTFVASAELAQLERDAGRRPVLVAPVRDPGAVPDPMPEPGTVVAVVRADLGRDTDWALLRDAAERLGDRLVVLVLGNRRDGEIAGDADAQAVARHPSFVWLGRRTDAEAARIAQAADVGLVPLRRDDFNDATLPASILELARLGRRTVVSGVAGARTWDRAVVVAEPGAGLAQALARHAGARLTPDAELRAWALAQTTRTQDDPLWQRLLDAGVDVRVSR